MILPITVSGVPVPYPCDKSQWSIRTSASGVMSTLLSLHDPKVGASPDDYRNGYVQHKLASR